MPMLKILADSGVLDLDCQVQFAQTPYDSRLHVVSGQETLCGFKALDTVYSFQEVLACPLTFCTTCKIPGVSAADFVAAQTLSHTQALYKSLVKAEGVPSAVDLGLLAENVLGSLWLGQHTASISEVLKAYTDKLRQTYTDQLVAWSNNPLHKARIQYGVRDTLGDRNPRISLEMQQQLASVLGGDPQEYTAGVTLLNTRVWGAVDPSTPTVRSHGAFEWRLQPGTGSKTVFQANLASVLLAGGNVTSVLLGPAVACKPEEFKFWVNNPGIRQLQAYRATQI